MRISELSRRTGVPVPTVKFYLREGLLPAGRATAATQAQYDEGHEQRLRLVRALVEVAGLSLAAVRRVVAAVDDPPRTTHELLGAAHEALPPAVADDVDVTAATGVVAELGWRIDPRSAPLRQLAAAIAALEAVGMPAGVEVLARYGRALEPVATAEVAAVPTSSREDAVAFVVVGTALYEPVVLALRRLAQQDASARRFGVDCP
ncbi:MAG: Regulatory protein MerR [uncultured Quadrisphaera sp.]|uniref:Regulatory protein MerR n=1 Tax=uncultured Quadrisphaera sp. TaxID=904978 RepID=A0A6J4PH10_9ACTN|nr:MAG: Regulatory protein MerR [uncultured Quadrisphaera sp.]